LVALSGGADSSVLLAALVKAGQGPDLAAATLASPLHPPDELARAKRLAAKLKVEHLIIKEDPLADPDFAANPADRCYLCKKRRLAVLARQAGARGLEIIVDGTNFSDSLGRRPGAKALAQAKAATPLAQARLTKDQVLALGRELGLSDWLKPASACLATRVAYGQSLTAELLDRIRQAEELVGQAICAEAGSFRVRVEGHLARIEAEPEKWPPLWEPKVRAKLVGRLKEMGFVHVSLDLAGFHSGSMDWSLERSRGDDG
ncbi:MAG: ATP-dependent sacrificial sulfur transferase LarE, partial [Deltaproteobacteria bacterium]|nr:ATP-dependent sacrificial sulfur transferase LarE [Deltaproteobacteria bacterium]